MTTPSPAARVAALSDVLARARELLDAYEGTDGVSPQDDYADGARVHPMAEAKYVMACVELANAGALSVPTLRRRIKGSLGRLEAADVSPDFDMACWGLGFSFRDLPVDEPFTITTALVLDALTRALPFLDATQSARCRGLQARTLRWMLSGLERVHEGGVDFPAYSPGLLVAANNVAAYWAGSISRALPSEDPDHEDARRVASAVLDRFLSGVGWPYSADSSRVDLVHNCYTGWGLLSALPERTDEIALIALAALLNFSGQTWTDRFDARDLTRTFAEDAPRAGRVTRVAGGMALVGFDTPARAWSVGEALVLLGTLTGVEQVAPFCYRELRALATLVVREYHPEQRYRHAMHIAHGLGATVRVARRLAAAVPGEGETKERA